MTFGTNLNSKESQGFAIISETRYIGLYERVVLPPGSLTASMPPAAIRKAALSSTYNHSRITGINFALANLTLHGLSKIKSEYEAYRWRQRPSPG